MSGKLSVPRKIVKEIDLASFLNSFPHLAKPQDYKVKGMDSTLIRMSHSGMSFGEYYERLKSYSGIGDIEVRSAKKRLFGAENPFTIIVYDKTDREIYRKWRLDSSRIRALIAAHYTLANPGTVEKIMRKIPDGEYTIDRNGKRYERRKYRYIFLYSTGDKVDLKNCMLMYQLSKEDIVKALKCGIWISERNRGVVAAEEETISDRIKDLEKRLLLKRFDIYFTLTNLHRIVLKKAEENNGIPELSTNYTNTEGSFGGAKRQRISDYEFDADAYMKRPLIR